MPGVTARRDVVVITGASAGVGRAAARAFARRGAHGRFDAVARDRAPQLWASMHRGWIAAAAAVGAGAALSLSLRRRA